MDGYLNARPCSSKADYIALHLWLAIDGIGQLRPYREVQPHSASGQNQKM